MSRWRQILVEEEVGLQCVMLIFLNFFSHFTSAERYSPNPFSYTLRIHYIQFRLNVFDLLISQVEENASFIDASDGFSSSFVVQGKRMDSKNGIERRKEREGFKNFTEKQTYERRAS